MKPGAGRPLVEGPPASVGEPIPARTINRTAGMAGLLLLGVAGVVTLVVLVVVVLAILGRL
ncbi:MAG: hypothetical protein DLM67_07550 [Candidatus Nephthysia bennettiae]|nr:MAG: hypothetical protein DLM67_07550 [Candidatus Dormibacteraeota bacterium]